MTNAYNAAERKDVRAAEKADRLVALQRQEIMASIMSLPASRAWMWDILVSCHVFAPTFALNPYSTAFAEGERNIGLRLLADIMSACPDQYVQMTREANERDASRNAARTNRNGDASRSTDEAGPGDGAVERDEDGIDDGDQIDLRVGN